MNSNINTEEVEVYSFLSDFFYHIFFEPISENFWRGLSSENAFEWVLKTDNSCGKEGRALLARSFKEDKLDDILVDFTALFMCEEQYLEFPPYASYYFDPKGEIYSEESIDVKNLYASLGYMVANRVEPEDHLAFEFGFIGYLIQEIASSDKDIALRTLDKFVGYNLLPWALICLKSKQQKARTYFYKSMAYLAEDFLITIQKRFDIKPVKRKIYNS